MCETLESAEYKIDFYDQARRILADGSSYQRGLTQKGSINRTSILKRGSRHYASLEAFS